MAPRERRRHKSSQVGIRGVLPPSVDEQVHTGDVDRVVAGEEESGAGDDGATLGVEPTGDRSTDPGSGAGDHSGLALEACTGHRNFFVWTRHSAVPRWFDRMTAQLG